MAWEIILEPLKATLTDYVTGQVVEQALKHIVKMESEEMRLLLSIDSKLDALLQGPFQSGLTWLGEAEKRHRSPDEREANLRMALSKFIDAEAQQLKQFKRAAAQLHVALCYALLQQPIDAREWFVKAYQTADSSLHDEAIAAERRAGQLWRVFGTGQITDNFIALMHRYNDFLSAIREIIGTADLRNDSGVWRTETDEWEERVPAIEIGDSGWVTRRATFVYKGDKVVAKLP